MVLSRLQQWNQAQPRQRVEQYDYSNPLMALGYPAGLLGGVLAGKSFGETARGSEFTSAAPGSMKEMAAEAIMDPLWFVGLPIAAMGAIAGVIGIGGARAARLAKAGKAADISQDVSRLSHSPLGTGTPEFRQLLESGSGWDMYPFSIRREQELATGARNVSDPLYESRLSTGPGPGPDPNPLRTQRLAEEEQMWLQQFGPGGGVTGSEFVPSGSEYAQELARAQRPLAETPLDITTTNISELDPLQAALQRENIQLPGPEAWQQAVAHRRANLNAAIAEQQIGGMRQPSRAGEVKVISGAQEGVDQFGLVWGESKKAEGVVTGGTMPPGAVTKFGEAPHLLDRYGLKVSTEADAAEFLKQRFQVGAKKVTISPKTTRVVGATSRHRSMRGVEVEVPAVVIDLGDAETLLKAQRGEYGAKAKAVAEKTKRIVSKSEVSPKEYEVRTWMNVRDSDVTLWFGDTNTAGYGVTKRSGLSTGVPVLDNPTPEVFAEWVSRHNPRVWNVAGNADSPSSALTRIDFNPQVNRSEQRMYEKFTKDNHIWSHDEAMALNDRVPGLFDTTKSRAYTTTADRLAEAGLKTSYVGNRTLGKVGEKFKLSGSPTQYIVTETELITPQMLGDAAFMDKLSKSEGLTKEFLLREAGTKKTVYANLTVKGEGGSKWITRFRKAEDAEMIPVFKEQARENVNKVLDAGLQAIKTPVEETLQPGMRRWELNPLTGEKLATTGVGGGVVPEMDIGSRIAGQTGLGTAVPSKKLPHRLVLMEDGTLRRMGRPHGAGGTGEGLTTTPSRIPPHQREELGMQFTTDIEQIPYREDVSPFMQGDEAYQKRPMLQQAPEEISGFEKIAAGQNESVKTSIPRIMKAVEEAIEKKPFSEAQLQEYAEIIQVNEKSLEELRHGEFGTAFDEATEGWIAEEKVKLDKLKGESKDLEHLISGLEKRRSAAEVTQKFPIVDHETGQLMGFERGELHTSGQGLWTSEKQGYGRLTKDEVRVLEAHDDHIKFVNESSTEVWRLVDEAGEDALKEVKRKLTATPAEKQKGLKSGSAGSEEPGMLRFLDFRHNLLKKIDAKLERARSLVPEGASPELVERMRVEGEALAIHKPSKHFNIDPLEKPFHTGEDPTAHAGSRLLNTMESIASAMEAKGEKEFLKHLNPAQRQVLSLYVTGKPQALTDVVRQASAATSMAEQMPIRAPAWVSDLPGDAVYYTSVRLGDMGHQGKKQALAAVGLFPQEGKQYADAGYTSFVSTRRHMSGKQLDELEEIIGRQVPPGKDDPTTLLKSRTDDVVRLIDEQRSRLGPGGSPEVSLPNNNQIMDLGFSMEGNTLTVRGNANQLPGAVPLGQSYDELAARLTIKQAMDNGASEIRIVADPLQGGAPGKMLSELQKILKSKGQTVTASGHERTKDFFRSVISMGSAPEREALEESIISSLGMEKAATARTDLRSVLNVVSDAGAERGVGPLGGKYRRVEQTVPDVARQEQARRLAGADPVEEAARVFREEPIAVPQERTGPAFSVEDLIESEGVTEVFGKRSRLSNFHPAQSRTKEGKRTSGFVFEGKRYRTAEGAYQANKSGTYQKGFEKLDGKTARKLGSKITVDTETSDVLMKRILEARYDQDESFRSALLKAGEITHPVNDVYWRDNFPRLLQEVKNEKAAAERLARSGPAGFKRARLSRADELKETGLVSETEKTGAMEGGSIISPEEILTRRDAPSILGSAKPGSGHEQEIHKLVDDLRAQGKLPNLEEMQDKIDDTIKKLGIENTRAEARVREELHEKGYDWLIKRSELEVAEEARKTGVLDEFINPDADYLRKQQVAQAEAAWLEDLKNIQKDAPAILSPAGQKQFNLETSEFNELVELFVKKTEEVQDMSPSRQLEEMARFREETVPELLKKLSHRERKELAYRVGRARETAPGAGKPPVGMSPRETRYIQAEELPPIVSERTPSPIEEFLPETGMERQLRTRPEDFGPGSRSYIREQQVITPPEPVDIESMTKKIFTTEPVAEPGQVEKLNRMKEAVLSPDKLKAVKDTLTLEEGRGLEVLVKFLRSRAADKTTTSISLPAATKALEELKSAGLGAAGLLLIMGFVTLQDADLKRIAA